jgi:tellurium resistance protein TerD
MSILLKKGESINLSKKEPALRKILIGLGWELIEGNQLDLDASMFMLGKNGKLPSSEHFIFYNNLKSPDGAIQHTGDNRSGLGEGDDEIILANLPLISSEVRDIVILVSIHEAIARRHNFGMLSNAYIHLQDVETKRELLRYDLDADFTQSTEMEFGRLSLINQEWHFEASGFGTHKGLQSYVDIYL